ncbi:helix-turn-helix transcriptional regulator, partial [Pseudomonas protegens]|uniref:helix-turn-helix transcriptional regulator n=1 Tax=Pseudomonas protegens TaxID=380021 RepID=UPI0034D7865B
MDGSISGLLAPVKKPASRPLLPLSTLSGSNLGMPTLGARVKALRVSARLSQPALAKLVGISQSAIGQIE